MNRLFTAGFVGAAIVALAVTTSASGPEWGEVDDAGSLPPGQNTIGPGPLMHIVGNLNMPTESGEVDFEDMFRIRIINPEIFRATTDEDDQELQGAFSKFNSQLWLFKPLGGESVDALGFLGNDDHPDTGSFQSLLIPLPTDGSPPLVDPGIYFIAITRAISPVANDPISAAGPIFDQALPTEISGPDGPGGLDPIVGWTGDKGGFDGAYRIALRGVLFAQLGCPWDLDGSGDVGLADLLELLASWGPCAGCPADFDDSGDIGLADLLALLAHWGPCP